MKIAGLTIMMLGMMFFNVCARRSSRHITEVLAKKRSAEAAAQKARQWAAEVEKARASRDFERVPQLLRKRREEAEKVERLSAEIREALKKTDGDEKQIVNEAFEEVQRQRISVRLEENISDDLQHIEEKEGSSFLDNCRAPIEGFFKSMPCFYLKTYAKLDRFPNDDELEQRSIAAARHLCLPREKTSLWWKRGQALQGILKDLSTAETTTQRLRIAAAAYACDLK